MPLDYRVHVHVHIYLCVHMYVLNSVHTFPLIEVKLLINALHIGGGELNIMNMLMHTNNN